MTPAGFMSPKSSLGSADVDLAYLHPFGCLAWFKIPEANRKKLDPKACASILLSYLSDGKGYRLWDLERKVVVKSRDYMFEDSRFPYSSPVTSPPETITVELPWPKPQAPSIPATLGPAPDTRTPTLIYLYSSLYLNLNLIVSYKPPSTTQTLLLLLLLLFLTRCLSPLPLRRQDAPLVAPNRLTVLDTRPSLQPLMTQ